ncbi:hypothetical protein [Acaryochloris sp. IP29b_bin.148]|uniref:hypothetical protein n=1 Tax=Acaryochloris sp. IP29b_bin.148 TaxID=2969218 RepID=UPI00260447C1|nr:hypothetical protein [Acaryochloris sp. IP29b_bin.148]
MASEAFAFEVCALLVLGSLLDMKDEPTRKSYSQIVKLIFEDAQESIKSLDSNINNLNTKLSAIVGFGVVLIKSAGNLSDQSLEITGSEWSGLLSCYSCSVLKALTLILLVISTVLSVRALLPRKEDGKDQIISPAEQVEKCLELSEDEYRLLFIKEYDQAIESLVKRRDWKAKQLNWSGEALVAAATLSALDLLLALSLK